MPTETGTNTVLIYSQRPEVREQLRTAIGRRPAADVGRVEYIETAENDEVMAWMDRGGIDLAILDGEAQPTGGMGLCRTIKMEIAAPPLLCVLIRRRDDRWLATWSQADATITYPLDAVTAAETVATLLRQVAPATR